MLKRFALFLFILCACVALSSAQEDVSQEDIITPVDIQGFRYEELEFGTSLMIDRVPYSLTDKENLDREEANQMVMELAVQGVTVEDLPARVEWGMYYNTMQNWQRYIEERIFLNTPRNAIPDDLFLSGNRLYVLDATFKLMEMHIQEAQEINQEEQNRILDIYGTLQIKKAEYENYHIWLEERLEYVREFAQDWLKRVRGEELTIEGNVYLVSPVALTEEVEGVVPLVTDKVTPYDLLDENGKLKEPAE